MNNLEASKSSVEEGFVSELISRAAYYDTDDQDDGEDSVNGLDDPSSKKRRLNDDERLQRWCVVCDFMSVFVRISECIINI